MPILLRTLESKWEIETLASVGYNYFVQGQWAIEFYTVARGTSPIEDFFSQKRYATAASAMRGQLELARMHGPQSELVDAKPLSGPIWEIRAHVGKE